MPPIPRTALNTAFATLLSVGAASAQNGPLLVTSTADSGEGSLRAALEQAEGQGAPTTIIVLAEGEIALETGLSYGGVQPLTILGRGQDVVTTRNETLLSVTGGADLVVQRLGFRGPGGFSIENRGDTDGASAGKGIFVDVADDQERTLRVTLDQVSVADVAGHGIHISDCSLADDCGGGAGGGGDGAPASIDLRVNAVEVVNVGQGRFDADGIRVDERGPGSVRFIATGATFERVGADGVEIDEGQAGDVIVEVSGARFTDNGNYCDPEVLAPILPDPAEGEFDAGAMQEADIPGPVAGTPDDGCFEREVSLYEDGTVEAFEIALDLDDAFDVDEAGAGSITGYVAGGEITGNLDEGLDFDEAGDGGVDLVISEVVASGNTDDGFKVSEEDAGSVFVTVLGGSATDNGGAGAVFEEADAGDALVSATGFAATGNDDGETGLEVVQEDDGIGRLSLRATPEGNDPVATEGVEISED